MRRQAVQSTGTVVSGVQERTATRPWPVPPDAVAEGVALVEAACRDRRCGPHGLETVLGHVARSAGFEVGHAYVNAGPPGGAASGPVLPTRLWYLHPPTGRYAAFVRTTAASTLVPGEGLPGRVLCTGTPVVLDPLPGDAHMARARSAIACGLRAACAYPVPAHAGLTVVLEFLAGGPVQRTAELDTLVGRLAGALVPHLRDVEVEDLL